MPEGDLSEHQCRVVEIGVEVIRDDDLRGRCGGRFLVLEEHDVGESHGVRQELLWTEAAGTDLLVRVTRPPFLVRIVVLVGAVTTLIVGLLFLLLWRFSKESELLGVLAALCPEQRAQLQFYLDHS